MTNKTVTKTIVIEQSTYDRLKDRKVIERESFNSVINGMFDENETLKAIKQKKAGK